MSAFYFGGINMSQPKFPKVREYADGLLIDGKEVPYILLDNEGNTTTKATSDGNYVTVTITFLAKSYHLDPYKRIHDGSYQFKKKPLHKRLFSKLRYSLKRIQA